MPTPTDDRRDLLTVIASMRAAPGKRDSYERRRKRWSSPPAGRRGTSTTTCTRASRTPSRFSHENRESDADLDAHLDAPHLRDFAARIPEQLDDGGLSVTRARRIA